MTTPRPFPPSQLLHSSAIHRYAMVNDCAAVLARLHFLQRELILLQAGWLPAVVHWETKLALPEITWQDALQSHALRQRVLELRFPERRLVAGEGAGLLSFWRQTGNAPGAAAFVAGLARVVEPFVLNAVEGYLATADRNDDGPTLRVLETTARDCQAHIARLAALHEEDMRRHPALVADCDAWVERVRDHLGKLPADWITRPAELLKPALDGPAIGCAFQRPSRARRDPRFRCPAFAWPDRQDEKQSAGEGVEFQLRVEVHHTNEVWAAEVPASVLHELADQAPPEFVLEMARWSYDEIRHAQMGYRRLRDWGFADEDIPLDTFLFEAASDDDPLVRLGIIFYFESTYIHTRPERVKKFGGEGDTLGAHDADFEWADELIHTHLGKKWLTHFLTQRGEPVDLDRFRKLGLEAVERLRVKGGPAAGKEANAIRELMLTKAAGLITTTPQSA